MKKAHAILKSTKLVLIVFIMLGTLCASTLEMPTTDNTTDDHHEVLEKIEIFKMDILNRLGYTRTPSFANVTISIEEKRRLIQEYKKYISDREGSRLQSRRNSDGAVGEYVGDDDEDDDATRVVANTLYSYQYKGDHPPNVNTDAWSIKNTIRMYFPITLGHPENDFYKELKISSAKLRVNIIKTFPDNLVDEFTVDQIIRVNLYQVLSIHNATKYKRTLLDSKLIDLTRPWSESFELQKAVQSWTNDHTANMGIELAVDSQDINDLIQIEMPDHMKIELNASISGALPTLVVYAQEREILKRVKRGSSKRGDKCKRKAGETKCCRYSININFAEIGWDDWIIAPSGYKGFYCAGECPYGHKMANNFAGIKALLHLKNPAKVPSPCCVATKLKPLTILHYDHEGKYRFTEYEDMIVTQCKCG